ncbi:MAG: nuclear transport factor 2 family protein [Acidimicrobiales bacterium]|jgi:hypothetical protein
MPQSDTTQPAANRLKIALEGADVDAFAQLLDPNVRWGPPDAPSPPCRNKEQVLSWYRSAASEGARAQVVEMDVIGDRVVVELLVQRAAKGTPRGEPSPRWQVYTLRDGLIVDIVGFDTRSEANERARISG